MQELHVLWELTPLTGKANMKIDEIQSNAPIRLSDGAFGLVIRFGDDEIGVQVPGEDEIRWVPLDEVIGMGEGALVQKKGENDEQNYTQ